jgi:nicotinamide riboside kinase
MSPTMRNKEKIVIGFMGSSCSGKTTTARLLSKELGFILQEEVESLLLLEWISKDLIKGKNDLYPSLSKKFQDEALSIRENGLLNYSKLLTDRTPADLLVYNRIYVQPYFDESYKEGFTNKVIKSMRGYTNLFLFPCGILDLEDNKLRTVDLQYQRRIHDELIKILDEFGIEHIVLSSDKMSISQRVEEVKNWLKI